MLGLVASTAGCISRNLGSFKLSPLTGCCTLPCPLPHLWSSVRPASEADQQVKLGTPDDSGTLLEMLLQPWHGALQPAQPSLSIAPTTGTRHNEIHVPYAQKQHKQT